MKLIKTHKIANRKKGQVEFGSQPGGKWMFKIGRYIKITKVPGGLKTAERIAEALHNSWLRTVGKVVVNDVERIDGVCRGVMERLLHMPSLADHKPVNASWDNPHAAWGQTVRMREPAKKFRKGVEPSWHLPPKGISAEDLEVTPALPVIHLEVAPILPVVPIEADAVAK